MNQKKRLIALFALVEAGIVLWAVIGIAATVFIIVR